MFKIVTARQVVNAIRHSNLPRTKGGYVQYANGQPIAGCAYGQAALALGVNPKELDTAFEKFLMKIVGIVNYYEPHITHLSDNTALSFPEIAYRVESWLTDLNIDLDRSRIQVGA